MDVDAIEGIVMGCVDWPTGFKRSSFALSSDSVGLNISHAYIAHDRLYDRPSGLFSRLKNSAR